MEFYVSGKKYDIDYEELYTKYIDSGTGADVYKFGKKVFKIYKPVSFKYRIDNRDVNYLKEINTKRILLPNEGIYNSDGQLIGYTMKYLKEEDKKDIKNIKISKLLTELKLIKDDLITLKDKNVFVDDFIDKNFIYNNGIYFTDPGSYEINKRRTPDYIEIINREIMNDFIIKYILFREYKLSPKTMKKLREYYPLNEYIYDSVRKDINKNEEVYDYTKGVMNKILNKL